MDVYSGISLLRPFSSVILMLAGFLSTGCGIVCSRLIGAGKREEANETFNLATFLSLAFAVLLIVLSLCFPTAILNISGVDLGKYPELNPYLYSYLKGFLIGIPALMLVQTFSPVLVMDGGKRVFTISSLVLCGADIIGDLLNVYVFHGGAFGMGLATSVAYYLQLLVLFIHFLKRSSYFRLSLKACTVRSLKDIIKNGTPALVKKLAGTVRDILINYIYIMVALSAVAIAARGIQSDLFQFLFCIPTGLGRTLITMVGIYYSANDLLGLKRLLAYAARFGAVVSGAASLLTFLFAPRLTSLYTSDPEVSALAVYSIRWMSVALVFDTAIVLVQHYLQGTNNLKRANILSIGERFVVPTLCALILGLTFGSKGILVSVAVSKFVLLLFVCIGNCIYNKGIPKEWTQLMFLPKEFGGKQSDNMYAEIRTLDGAVEISGQARQFCLEHNTDEAVALYISLFVEKMTVNVFEHAQKSGIKKICVDFRLFVSEGNIFFSMMDLSEQFDPTLFYEIHQNDEPSAHIGIRMVTNMAKEIHYFSTFKSNNLTVVI